MGTTRPGHELEDIWGVGKEREGVEGGRSTVGVKRAIEAAGKGFLKISRAGVGVLPENGVAVGEGDAGALRIGFVAFMVWPGQAETRRTGIVG